MVYLLNILMTNQKKIITIDQIFLQIKNKKIFENLSLSFSSKGITVILGPNGSGKTILIKLILGLQKMDKGIIKITNYKNIKFGYTPQKTILLRRNVFDNIAFPLIMDGCNKNEISEKVNLYLKRFNIEKIEIIPITNITRYPHAFCCFLFFKSSFLINSEIYSFASGSVNNFDAV